MTNVSWRIHATKTVSLPDGETDFAADDRDGKRTFVELLPIIRPDIVFAFNDPQNLLRFCVGASERTHKLVLYVTFDGWPVPSGFDDLLKADCLVTTSEFGKRSFLQSQKDYCNSEKIRVMYSPADITRFVPISDEQRQELRRDLFPSWMPTDSFVLGWVGVNQWRKQIWILYQSVF